MTAGDLRRRHSSSADRLSTDWRERETFGIFPAMLFFLLLSAWSHLYTHTHTWKQHLFLLSSTQGGEINIRAVRWRFNHGRKLLFYYCIDRTVRDRKKNWIDRFFSPPFTYWWIALFRLIFCSFVFLLFMHIIHNCYARWMYKYL